MKRIKLNDRFEKISDAGAYFTGHPFHFLLSVLLLAVWVVSGPWFDFSDTWQLVINTGTTIVTWLLVILIQNSQNRNDHATHVKLDGIINALDDVSNNLIGIEKKPTSEIDKHEEELYYDLDD
jgi:low affinity Fe/Cu permease